MFSVREYIAEAYEQKAIIDKAKEAMKQAVIDMYEQAAKEHNIVLNETAVRIVGGSGKVGVLSLTTSAFQKLYGYGLEFYPIKKDGSPSVKVSLDDSFQLYSGVFLDGEKDVDKTLADINKMFSRVELA